MQTIPLYGRKANGRVALIDDEDYELVSQYRWHVMESQLPGRRPAGPYAEASLPNGRRQPPKTLMHRLITGYAITDHINHDGLDNRRANLREATVAQNQQNRRANGASAFKGVAWDRQHSRWVAKIAVSGRTINLGRFAAEVDAARAYDAAAVELFGEFAFINFPD